MARSHRGWIKWAIGAVVGVVVLAVAVPFVYIHFIEGDAPDKLALPSTKGSTTTTAPGDSTPVSDGVEGTWNVSDGSKAGYRVPEVLVGQSTTAVGRTNDVTGSFVLTGTSVESGSFKVDMSTVSSDQSRRDGQFRRALDTSSNPDATFTLTKPIDLGTIPADGETTKVTATGDLTLKGTKKSVEIPLTVRRSGTSIDVLGTYEVTFADFGIQNPSIGPAQVGDTGSLEFLLVFTKGAPSAATTTTTIAQSGDDGGQIVVPSTTAPPLGI